MFESVVFIAVIGTIICWGTWFLLGNSVFIVCQNGSSYYTWYDRDFQIHWNYFPVGGRICYERAKLVHLF